MFTRNSGRARRFSRNFGLVLDRLHYLGYFLLRSCLRVISHLPCCWCACSILGYNFDRLYDWRVGQCGCSIVNDICEFFLFLLVFCLRTCYWSWRREFFCHLCHCSVCAVLTAILGCSHHGTAKCRILVAACLSSTAQCLCQHCLDLVCCMLFCCVGCVVCVFLYLIHRHNHDITVKLPKLHNTQTNNTHTPTQDDRQLCLSWGSFLCEGFS